MAKAQSRWDYVETGRGRIRVTHDNVLAPPSPPETDPVERVSETPEQTLTPNVRGRRFSFWRGVWPAIRRVPFWPTVKVVLIVCMTVVLIVVTASLVDFLADHPVGRIICKLIGLTVVIVGFVIAKRQGFFR